MLAMLPLLLGLDGRVVSTCAATRLTADSLSVRFEHSGGQAASMFRENGVVALRNVASSGLVAQAQRIVESNVAACRARLEGRELELGLAYAEIAHRSDRRFDVSLGATAAVPGSHEELLALVADAPWLPLVEELLGPDCKLLEVGAVVSAPGSQAQRPHRDGTQLFPGVELPCDLPPYCLSVFLPLVQVTDINGPTEFLPGSHSYRPQLEQEPREEPIALTTSIGDAIVFDFRVVHRGQANRGEADRPVLYLTYARPWFRDHINFGWQRGEAPKLMSDAAVV